MKKKYLFICLLFLIALFSMPMYGEAKDDIGNVYVHESPDGTVSFFAQHTSKPFSVNLYSVLELHKVIAPDKNYYAIRACVAKYKAYETPIKDVTLNLDGIDYPLMPLEGARKDDLLSAVQGWYMVPDELLEKLINTKKLSMKITYTNGKTREDDQGDNFIKSIKRLGFITKENYKQQQNIIQAKNDYSLFIPGVKPEEILPAIIYNVNYGAFSKKDELQSSYYQVSFSNDNKFLAFYNVLSYSDNTSFCGWVNLVQQANGTWVTLDFLELHRYYGWRKMNTDGNAGIMNLYRACDIVDAVIMTYKFFYGTYDYGFTWEPIISEKDSQNITRSKWRPGPFKVGNVNSKLFPELEQIKAGDIVTEINGVSTQSMNYMDSLEKVVGSGEKVTFTLKDSQGNQKVVAIQPKFIPSERSNKNFFQIIANDKRQFVEFDNNRDYPFNFPMSYNPLGKGAQLGGGFIY